MSQALHVPTQTWGSRMTDAQTVVAHQLRWLEEHLNMALAEAVAVGLTVLITVKPESDGVPHPTIHVDPTVPEKTRHGSTEKPLDR
jgi:hypothetical protein